MKFRSIGESYIEHLVEASKQGQQKGLTECAYFFWFWSLASGALVLRCDSATARGSRVVGRITENTSAREVENMDGGARRKRTDWCLILSRDFSVCGSYQKLVPMQSLTHGLPHFLSADQNWGVQGCSAVHWLESNEWICILRSPFHLKTRSTMEWRWFRS